MSILDRFDKVESVLSGMDKALTDYGESLMQSSEVGNLIVDLNIKQMDEGFRADDTTIEPEYTANTVEIKKSKGQPYNRVTLQDTGDFKMNIKVKAGNSKAEILSSDSKSDDLQEKYGKAIFGLNDEHLAMLRAFLQPQFQLFLRNYVNK